ncbi:hypothetical protein EI94DRAFT_968481 [Lactarius quietus]|nr:hypothetical protein EI94DRAFT_968481 [Lactarius quietus]
MTDDGSVRIAQAAVFVAFFSDWGCVGLGRLSHRHAFAVSIVTAGKTAGFPEVAARFSVGSFSDYFQHPSYQT